MCKITRCPAEEGNIATIGTMWSATSSKAYP